MKKQQIVLISSGVVLLCLIYFFGRTVPPKKQGAPATATTDSLAITIDQILAASRQQLSVSQQEYISRLETAVVRGDVKDQQIKVFRQLAAFWKDSAHALLPFAYYSAEAAKLENSPKSLTFAAQFYLDGIRRQGEPTITHWMALQAKELFEKALQLDPGNDSLKVGLGSVYLFGNISDNPMEGISLIREVADRDPENMYAQFMLGLGGVYSGQLDRAAERLLTVVTHEPDNLEAIMMLADVYERKKDNASAIKWYETGKKKISNPAIVQEIDQRISNLKK